MVLKNDWKKIRSGASFCRRSTRKRGSTTLMSSGRVRWVARASSPVIVIREALLVEITIAQMSPVRLNTDLIELDLSLGGIGILMVHNLLAYGRSSKTRSVCFCSTATMLKLVAQLQVPLNLTMLYTSPRYKCQTKVRYPALP